MHIHIALFRWKDGTTPAEVSRALADLEALANKVPGIVDIVCGENTSRYAEGYTHVVLVRGGSQESIDAYRAHPDHVDVAERIDAMEAAGIGVDFASGSLG